MNIFMNEFNELQTFIRNQKVQTGETFPLRKRFRTGDENDSETMSDVMETEKYI